MSPLVIARRSEAIVALGAELAANRRVLVVDDNPSIHDDLRKTLCPDDAADPGLTEIEAELFGDSSPAAAASAFTLTSAYQGQEALALVVDSLQRGLPYAMAFVDVRMPPGWDGIETIERLWEVDPELQVVICTAFSDHSWSQISKRLGHRDGLLVLRKPFEMIEALQMATSLTQKWESSRRLQRRMDEHIELHRFRDEMSGLLVHDLKSPLSALLASIAYASEGLAGTSIDSEVLSALDDSRSSAQRMLRLLGNLLAVASAEAGRLKPGRAQVRIEALFSELVAQRRCLAQTREVTIEVRVVGDPLVSLDVDLMTRALENLFDNALRYTPRGGRVVISAARDDRGLSIAIGNTGPAIPLEARALIFEKFGRGSDQAGRMNLGLGLYFCRLVLEAHGGWLDVFETAELPTLFRMLVPSSEAIRAR